MSEKLILYFSFENYDQNKRFESLTKPYAFGISRDQFSKKKSISEKIYIMYQLIQIESFLCLKNSVT